MNLEGVKPSVDTRLSYSSSVLLSNCEQRYAYYKVEKAEIDKDAAKRDNSFFAIGTSFHYVLETSMHEKPDNITELLEYCVQNEKLKEYDVGLVHALVLQYLRLRKGSKLKAVKCEYSINHPDIIGFVDLIEADDQGLWYISDLKTAASFYDSKIAELPSNQQLCLYASFYREIAEDLGLDPDKFQGVRYLVATKSKAKQKKTETYGDFVLRLVDKQHVKAVFVTIPKELMRITQTRDEIMGLHSRSLELRKGDTPKKNFTYCNAFFKSCDYFSRCHGAENSELMESKKIIVERT